MKLRWFAFLIVLLAGCSSKHDYQNPPWNPEVPVKRAMQWMPISEQAGKAWGVSPRLITAIIAVESGGNPTLVSKSNAVKSLDGGKRGLSLHGLEGTAIHQRAEKPGT